MNVYFRSIHEPQPGDKWQWLVEQFWPSYQAWFLKEGAERRPKFLACEQAMRQYMPELLPTYERLTELAGGGDLEARFLSLYRPTPYLTGCSQAVWTRNQPRLIRNYDYNPKMWEGVLLHSSWNGRQVIAMSDCLWGVLDGINDAGLAVSLAFGGRKAVGDGFGIPLILRYILEFCDTTTEAERVLARVPSHMSYNVTLLDASGRHRTVFVAPDRIPIITNKRLATNHQEQVEWHEHAVATGTVDRAHFLALRLDDPLETAERFTSRFLEPPLYSTRFDHGWGTLYTAVYDPTSLTATYRWPGYQSQQSIPDFTERSLDIQYRRD
ncbi:MAG: C45 family autoproteolytic acyltransferase/hydrolase [Planctomycetota bacterium]|nr:C45 family autoproteolytic acyltransferase/hydrolase [Planctomycetota bacterium]